LCKHSATLRNTVAEMPAAASPAMQAGSDPLIFRMRARSRTIVMSEFGALSLTFRSDDA
jgi:hypothetical protein